MSIHLSKETVERLTLLRDAEQKRLDELNLQAARECIPATFQDADALTSVIKELPAESPLNALWDEHARQGYPYRPLQKESPLLDELNILLACACIQAPSQTSQERLAVPLEAAVATVASIYGSLPEAKAADCKSFCDAFRNQLTGSRNDFLIATVSEEMIGAEVGKMALYTLDKLKPVLCTMFGLPTKVTAEQLYHLTGPMQESERKELIKLFRAFSSRNEQARVILYTKLLKESLSAPTLGFGYLNSMWLNAREGYMEIRQGLNQALHNSRTLLIKRMCSGDMFGTMYENEILRIYRVMFKLSRWVCAGDQKRLSCSR